MLTPLDTSYACADGTPFPIAWDDPAHAALSFVWNDSHFPQRLTPLAAVVRQLMETGGSRAHEESGVPRPMGQRPNLVVNGYPYTRRPPYPAEAAAEREAAAGRLATRFGGSWGAWSKFCQPRIAAACAWLQTAPDTTSVALLAEQAGYGRGLTFVYSVGDEQNRLIGFCTSVFGSEGEALAYELTQGYTNATLEVDQSLWQVAQAADASPAVRQVFLESSADQLRAAVTVAGGEAVWAAFDACLAQYGWQAEGWDLACPTWNERPERPLGLVRRLLAERVPAPETVTAAAAARRETLKRELEERLPTDSAREQFRALLTLAASYVPVREGRALWQLTVTGSLRGALLRRGERLVREGSIAATEDVFFLLPDEIDSEPRPETAVLRERIAQRRQEWEEWRNRQPPVIIGGGNVVTPVPVETAGSAGSTTSQVPAVVRGIGASRGTYSGRARLIANADDGEALEAGEVLVCVMTTPAWTPLFGVAGAIVTDSGGILSHPSIAAREYGIPAVVGARDATTTIPDGAQVTVDGTAGTVTILG